MIGRISILTAVLLAGTTAWVVASQQEAFPHLRHANLFPACEGCHAGIPAGEPANAFPPPSLCATCHDGQRVAPVAWAGPTPRATNLVFSHTGHPRISCNACHGTGETGRMAVGRSRPATCIGCHTDESAPRHLDIGRDCSFCHAPLTAVAPFDADRIAGFPPAPGHGAADFLSDHAPAGPAEIVACATCHAKESCTRCHLNQDLPAIAALGPDARVAALVRGRAPEYPEPASHLDGKWAWAHAGAANDAIATCANCHTRESCTVCHRQATAEALPAAPAGDPRGVQLPAEIAAGVHRQGFALSHYAEAAAAGESCASCHTTSFCEDCHERPSSPVFHGPNFLARHAPEAYGNDSDCASCHNPELFCRACHTGVGLGSAGRLGVAFHTGNPLWIVGHGGAARQALETCASCHAQDTCLQCHSGRGGWRINPHGPNFDPDRVQSANRLLCLRCHRS